MPRAKHAAEAPAESGAGKRSKVSNDARLHRDVGDAVTAAEVAALQRILKARFFGDAPPLVDHSFAGKCA